MAETEQLKKRIYVLCTTCQYRNWGHGPQYGNHKCHRCEISLARCSRILAGVDPIGLYAETFTLVCFVFAASLLSNASGSLALAIIFGVVLFFATCIIHMMNPDKRLQDDDIFNQER